MAVVRINGKTSPFVRHGWFVCAECGEPHDRRSNAQKYCDDCRRLATSKKVAKYYKKHRRRLLKEKAAYRAANRDTILVKQRQYHIDTKAERRTRAELREMADG